MNRVYCFITRHYHWLLEPYVYLHDKYFNRPLTIVTDVPLTFKTKHTVMEMPEYCNHFYQDQMGRMIKEVVNQFPEPLVTISLPDFWPCRTVDVESMEKLEKHMLTRNIARLHLWSNYGEHGFNDIKVEEVDNILVKTVDPRENQIGATSGLLAIWNKEFLNSYYRDEWTWADFELSNGIFAKEEYDTGKWYSVITYPCLVDVNHVCLTQKKELAKLESLSDEDKEFARPFIPQGYEVVE